MLGAPRVLSGFSFGEGDFRVQKNENFTEGKILPALLRFAFPVLVALLLQAMYGAVDLLIIGKFGAASDISAVSTGSQIMQTVTVVITGLSMGITVLAGQKIGERLPEEAAEAVGSGICLFALLGIAVSVLMAAFAQPVSELMRAPEEAFAQTVLYVRICGGGGIFIVAYNILGSIFRGIGDSRMPLITVAIACVLNIGGDLLLIGVFHMGVSGAAIATVGAQAVSVVISFFIIRRRRLPFTMSKDNIRWNRVMVRKILSLGLPIALQDLLVSISFLVILAIVNSLGVVASAGLGIAEKLCGFVMLVPSAFMQAMSAFVAQNVGARKMDRAKKALAFGILTALLAGFVMGYFSFFHGDIMTAWFTTAGDTEVIMAGWDYLKAFAIDCLLTSFLFCFLGYFNGCGKTMFVMIQGIIGAFCVRIPISYLVSQTAGVTLFRIGLATPASTLVQIILCLFYFRRQTNLQNSTLESPGTADA